MPHTQRTPTDLPALLEAAANWVAQQEARILREGARPSAALLGYAAALGIAGVDRIRIHVDSEAPQPADPLLAAVLEETGMASPRGMCFRYGIFVKREEADNLELVVHEMVHTHQYERLGGIRGFLTVYIPQVRINYDNAPLEVEANERARQLCRSNHA